MRVLIGSGDVAAEPLEERDRVLATGRPEEVAVGVRVASPVYTRSPIASAPTVPEE